MRIKTAKKLLKKYDLFFGQDIFYFYDVVILNKNQNYMYLGANNWCIKVHDEIELNELIKKKGRLCIWFVKKKWYLGNILGNLMPGEKMRM